MLLGGGGSPLWVADITDWLKWFLQMYTRAVNRSQDTIHKALWVGQFWQKRSMAELNERQLKVIKRLVEVEPEGFQGGLTNRKYVSMTKTSRETAKRDLADLEEKGLIKRNSAKGRSVSYSLVTEYYLFHCLLGIHLVRDSPVHRPAHCILKIELKLVLFIKNSNR